MRTQPVLEPPAPVNRPNVIEGAADGIVDARLAQRVRGEFTEMPGMRLTIAQAARLFGLTIVIAEAVLDELSQASFLGRSGDGKYALAADSFGGEASREGSSRIGRRT
jgi:hypothetical protein